MGAVAELARRESGPWYALHKTNASAPLKPGWQIVPESRIRRSKTLRVCKVKGKAAAGFLCRIFAFRSLGSSGWELALVVASRESESLASDCVPRTPE